jgi:K+-transporting ATPase ATPase C chain
MNLIRAALVTFALMTIVTGVVYPLTLTVAAQFLMPAEAHGSLLFREGRAIGSALIGQEFRDPEYFWGRPSATAPSPYEGASSSGSNLGPLSDDLRTVVEERVDALRRADPQATGLVPVDLVTASGSGLDPHISPRAAYYQAARVARLRGLAPERIHGLIDSHTEGRWLGLLGEPRVHVLRLNLALDEEAAN